MVKKKESFGRKLRRIFIDADFRGKYPVLSWGNSAIETSQQWLKDAKPGRLFTVCWAALYALLGLGCAVVFPIGLIVKPLHLTVNDWGIVVLMIFLELAFISMSWYFISALRWMRRNWNKPRSTNIEW